jgi:hypothetical protein
MSANILLTTRFKGVFLVEAPTGIGVNGFVRNYDDRTLNGVGDR